MRQNKNPLLFIVKSGVFALSGDILTSFFEKIENNYCVFFQGVVIYYHTILLARVG